MSKSIFTELAELINSRRQEIISVLVATETYKMAEDEIERSLRLFKAIDCEQAEYLHELDISICSYLPLNQPLYSLALNVIVPSFVCQTIYYRPPKLLWGLHRKLFQIFNKILCGVKICPISRRQFLSEYCLNSNLVIFTGKLENALELKRALLPQTAMIYNGSAVNPIVISADAELRKAANDCILARLFNSGQDCMAPACIFIERKVASEFLKYLSNAIKKLSIGDNELPSTDIGPLIDEQSIVEFLEFKRRFSGLVCLDSNIDLSNKIMSPAILYCDNSTFSIDNIYFAPYFVVVGFNNVSEVQKIINTRFCELYAGYISLYGETAFSSQWSSGNARLISLYNSTLFDYEDGNKEFGGYGMGCNFIYNGKEFEVRPILMLREISRLFKR